MPIFNDTLLTDKGYIAANKAANGQGSFTLTRAVASPRDYKELSSAAMRQLTSLDNESAGKLAAQDNVDTRKTKITTKFSNELEPKGYTANTVGLYAKDDNGQEFLYSVTPSTIGQVIPEQNNNLFEGFELDIYVIVGNVQNMHVELTPGGDASVEYVNKVVSQAKDDINAILKLKMNRNADGTVPDSANFVSGIQKDGVDVATMDDTAKQFDNSVKFARDYADGVLGKPSATIKAGDSFNNYFDKYYHLNIGGVTLSSIGGSDGLPSQDLWGDFINIPNGNANTQFINDNVGTMYYRMQDNSWNQVTSYQLLQQYSNKIAQSALQTANAYTDEKVLPDIMGLPSVSMQPGDSFDNYIGKHVHLNINGINPYTDIGSGVGLPNQKMYGSFYTIPNLNATSQFVQNNIGERWYRTPGRAWVQVASSGNIIPIVHTNVRYIDLINADTNKFSFDQANATYEPNKKLITLHGSIRAKTFIKSNDPIFRFDIVAQNMNKVTGQSLNNTPINVDTDDYLQNVQANSTYDQSSGFLWNIEGITINLDYDASLKPKIPSWVPSGAVQLGSGSNLNTYGVMNGNPGGRFFMDNNTYYKPSNVSVSNSPVDSSCLFIMRFSNNSIAGNTWGTNYHGTQWIKAVSTSNNLEYYSRDVDVNNGYTGFNLYKTGWIRRTELEYTSWQTH